MTCGFPASGIEANQFATACDWFLPSSLSGTSMSRASISMVALPSEYAASFATFPALCPCRTIQSRSGQRCIANEPLQVDQGFFGPAACTRANAEGPTGQVWSRFPHNRGLPDNQLVGAAAAQRAAFERSPTW